MRQGIIPREEMEHLQNCISKNVVASIQALLDPWFENVNVCARSVNALIHRVEALEQRSLDDVDMAALINTVQALQARVRELEFEMAKLSNTVEGSGKGTESSPWR